LSRWQRRRVLLAALVAALALLPVVALAAEYVSGSDVRVMTPVIGDLYVNGVEVIINGDVSGDVIASGVTVTINGAVHGSVYVVGSQVVVRGKVDGALMAAATDLRLYSDIGGSVRAAALTLRAQAVTIGGDLVVTGLLPRTGSVKIDRGSHIRGEVALHVADASIDADVGGRVHGSVRHELQLGGGVGGPVQVTVGSLRFTNGAVISQPVAYTSDHEVLIDGGTTVTGALTHATPAHQSVQERMGYALVFAFLHFVWAAALGAFLLKVAPQLVNGAATALRQRPLPALGWGLLALVLTPMLAVGLLFTLVGIPVGLVVLAGYILAVYASQIVLAVIVGGAIAPARWRGKTNFGAAWKAMSFGLVVVVLARSIPIPGWYAFSSTVVAMLALGALFIHWFRRGPLTQLHGPAS
jgi:cytoskeletal protein CcmA (bactofilin family)